MCGAALRGPGEDHWGEECAARGHGVCVVCEDLVAIKYRVTEPRRGAAHVTHPSSGSASASRKAWRSSGLSEANRSRMS